MGQRQKWSEERIKRLYHEGRGRGALASYKPFIRVGDFSSLGVSRQTYCQKTGRVHHLLSNVEWEFFLMLQWARDVIDIREQYPLDRDLTCKVALGLRIHHPCYPGTHIPTVMTTDFMVTRVRDGEMVLEAYDTKRSEEAEDARTVEKLELVRASLATSNIAHHIAYHTKLPHQKIRNIEWIAAGDARDSEPHPAGYLDEHCARLLVSLANSNPSQLLYKYCATYDAAHGLRPGSALGFARLLMCQRAIKPDLNQPDLASAPLGTFEFNAQPGQLRAVGGM